MTDPVTELKRRERMSGPRKPNPKMTALEVENWNLKHQVGTPVRLRKDLSTIETTTRSEAYICASGHAVIFLEGVSGYYGLDRVDALPQHTESEQK